jgi:deoxyribose-phosphate aldolase
MDKIEKTGGIAPKPSKHAANATPALSVVSAGALVTTPASATAAHAGEHRNPGTALKPEWFEGIQVNLSATERRAGTLGGRRTVKKEYQAAWLVKAMQCIDLTTLAGDDTPGRVHRLAAKARRPLREDIVKALGLEDAPPTVGAVCV